MSAPPERIASDLGPALEELPLFPLPHVVLLPGALLPLHVFEPRYRQMVKDVLGSHRSMAVVQIAEGEPSDADRPRIARVAGAGTIVDYAELPGGRYNIVLRGRARVELEELPFIPPYRRAKARILAATDENVSSTAMAALIATATAFVSVVKERDKSFDFRMPKLSDAGSLADHCAQHLLIDGRDRQRALETTSVADRVRHVTETLALQQLSLGAARGGQN